MTAGRDPSPHFGTLLGQWRVRRDLSRRDLARRTGLSERRLASLETGRRPPSRENVLRLASALDLAPQEGNFLLIRAGFTPLFTSQPDESPARTELYAALRSLVTAQEPHPALVFDSGWNLLAANYTVESLLHAVAADLLRPPVNLLRVTLHPEGLAPLLENLPVIRGHVMWRLRRQIALTGDSGLVELERELAGYATDTDYPLADHHPVAGLFVPIRLWAGNTLLEFTGSIESFATSIDSCLAGLAVESLLPRDEQTRRFLRRTTPAY